MAITNRTYEICMAQFTPIPHQFDPYTNFRFRLKWDGRYVAGVSKVSTLERSTDTVRHRESGDPSSRQRSPDRTETDSIMVESGVTHDPEFARWANGVHNYGGGPGVHASLRDLRKDIILEVFNEAGELALVYRIRRAWVSEYEALPELDANANAVAIGRLRLETEGWQLDDEVKAPVEPADPGPRG